MYSLGGVKHHLGATKYLIPYDPIYSTGKLVMASTTGLLPTG